MMSNLRIYVSQEMWDSGCLSDILCPGYDISIEVSENLTGNDWYLMDLDERKEEDVFELDEDAPDLSETLETIFGDECEWTGFEGMDYEELCDKWGLEHDPVEMLRNHIMSSIVWDEEEDCDVLDPDVKLDMAEFVRKLAGKKANYMFGDGIFAALLDLSNEDDVSFAQYFCTLLSHMWV